MREASARDGTAHLEVSTLPSPPCVCLALGLPEFTTVIPGSTVADDSPDNDSGSFAGRGEGMDGAVACDCSGGSGVLWLPPIKNARSRQSSGGKAIA